MTQPEHAVILVYSTSHAVRLEKIFKQSGVTNRMIPVPRQLSSDCGVSIQINIADLNLVKNLISQSGIEIQGIHEM